MRALAWLRTRLRAILQPARVERDLHDELQGHLDRHVELLIASGSTPSEARAEARWLSANLGVPVRELAGSAS